AELKYSALMAKLISRVDKLMFKLNPRGYSGFMSKLTSEYESSQKEMFDMFMVSKEAIPYIRGNLGNYSYLNTIKEMTIPYLLIKGEQDKEINRSLKSTLE